MHYPKIVDQPFGPYLDEEVLVESKILKNWKNKVYTLQSVVFEQDGQHVGLDHTSDLRARDRAAIRFRGFLLLEDLRWLSQAGEELLKRELRRRHDKYALGYFVKHEKNIRVLIQGTLHLHPAYLTKSKGLQIFSIDRTGLQIRQYDVISLNARTYSLSKLFLSRYRTLDALKAIVKRNPSTPIEERTPIWLVDKYFENINQRNDELRQNDSTFLPRHIHRSDIFNIFGQHSDWLQELVIKQKLLNKVAWATFCSEAKTRKQRRFWDNDKISIRTARWKHEASPAEVGSDMEDIEFDETSGWARRTYTYHVEGFSPPSSNFPDAAPKPSSDSDSDSDAPCKKTLGSSVIGRIPPQVIMTPVIPQDYLWSCPIPSCNYDINLLDLSRENLAGLHAKDQKWLLGKSWTLEEQRLCELFWDVAESHYFNHLRENGIKVFGHGTDEVDRHGRRIFRRRKINQPRQLRTDDNALFESARRWNGIDMSAIP
ncbi:hypothetical protein BD410DRAFT_780847 [Rickenella mellea]|uniref:Uncharacterized protein n=1 Tax=Rickenella mellea TaxID=50990 RepID=A0A4Y7QM80_9AGAM|nr:hypothetical protein BD410DRAFT_780847 [Rickenella mellea]